MGIMSKTEVMKLNATKLKTAVGGKKGLVLPLLEATKHIAEYGDYTVATDIINEWKGAECNFTHEAKAAINWFVKYVGLTYDSESKAFVGWQGEQFVRNNYKFAKENPYYNGITIAKEPEFDLDVEIGKLVSKANKMMKVAQAANDEGKEVKISVNVDHLAVLKGLKAA